MQAQFPASCSGLDNASGSDGLISPGKASPVCLNPSTRLGEKQLDSAKFKPRVGRGGSSVAGGGAETIHSQSGQEKPEEAAAGDFFQVWSIQKCRSIIQTPRVPCTEGLASSYGANLAALCQSPQMAWKSRHILERAGPLTPSSNPRIQGFPFGSNPPLEAVRRHTAAFPGSCWTWLQRTG